MPCRYTAPNAVTPYSIAIACVVKRGKRPWSACSNTVGITAQRLRGHQVGRRSVRATDPGRRVPANAAAALRAVGNLRFDQVGQLPQRLLPSEIAHLDGHRRWQAFLDAPCDDMMTLNARKKLACAFWSAIVEQLGVPVRFIERLRRPFLCFKWRRSAGFSV